MFEWSILPRQSNDSECFNPRCWNIYSYKTIELKANIAYQIDLGFHLAIVKKIYSWKFNSICVTNLGAL